MAIEEVEGWLQESWDQLIDINFSWALVGADGVRFSANELSEVVSEMEGFDPKRYVLVYIDIPEID